MRLTTTTLLAVLGLALTVTACQSPKQAPSARPAATAGGKSAALRNMEQVAQAAYRCWFKSNDPAFRKYSFANELNNFSGRPRFLLVPKNNYGGRPLLVVQAEGPTGRLETFGPLADQSQGSRINADVARWASGNPSCGSAA